jgi:hypothetical protein
MMYVELVCFGESEVFRDRSSLRSCRKRNKLTEDVAHSNCWELIESIDNFVGDQMATACSRCKGDVLLNKDHLS